MATLYCQHRIQASRLGAYQDPQEVRAVLGDVGEIGVMVFMRFITPYGGGAPRSLLYTTVDATGTSRPPPLLMFQRCFKIAYHPFTWVWSPGSRWDCRLDSAGPLIVAPVVVC